LNVSPTAVPQGQAFGSVFKMLALWFCFEKVMLSILFVKVKI
jgi:hypothetical protein